MKTDGPRYGPREVERLAREGRVVTTKRVATWLINHDYDSAAVIVEVLSSLEVRGRWLDSCVLKFYVDRERIVVSAWSCWWQGTAH
jgi:hypothetical protein